MIDVFLSYARNDEAQARQLKELLERRGFAVTWDGDLLPGPDYPQQIEKAVHAARCVVVLWTPDSVGSHWVLEEATLGRDQGKLVPAKLRDVEPPLGFRLSQTVDLRGWHGGADHPGIRRLETGVRAHFTEPPPQPAPSPKPLRWMARLGLLAPSLFAASAVAVLSWWPAPATLEADVLTTRFRFHTSAAEPQPLFREMPVRSLAVRGFDEVRLPPQSETRVAGSDAPLSGFGLVLHPSGADPARISVRPVDPRESLSIDGVSALLAEVTLDVPEPGSIGVTVRGAKVNAGASMPAEVQMIATACAGSAPAWPLDQPSVTLRSRVAPSSRLLEFSSAKGPLRLVLGLVPEPGPQTLKAVTADHIEFLQQASSGVVESTIVSGVLQFPGRNQPLSANDFLMLEATRPFQVRRVDLSAGGALRVHLYGRAGAVSYGPPGYLKRERFTMLSALARHYFLAGAVALIVWLLPQWWAWRWFRRAV